MRWCAAVGKEAVGEAEGHAVADLVAVAFVLVLVVEGFRVGEEDVRAFAAGDGELRVGGGEGFAVEEDVNVAARGMVTGGRREMRAGPACRPAAESMRTISPGLGGRILHVRQAIGNQAPEIVASSLGGVSFVDAGIDAVAHGRAGRNPGCGGVTRGVGRPVVMGGVDLFAGAGGEVLLEG